MEPNSFNTTKGKKEGEPCEYDLDCPNSNLKCQKKDPTCNDNGENTCDKICKPK